MAASSRSLIALIVLALASSALAIEDTEENRRLHMERYLEAVPPSDIMNDMIEHMPKTMTLEEQARFEVIMREYVDYDRLFSAMRDSMLRNFTAAELAALADFYSTPEAKSAMSKMGIYMSEIMPVVQREIMRAIAAEQKARESADEGASDTPQ